MGGLQVVTCFVSFMQALYLSAFVLVVPSRVPQHPVATIKAHGSG
jgi:hypothetical protein